MNQPLELTTMMYHYVRDPGDAVEAGSGIPGMSVKVFENQLDELARQHTLVTWPEVRMALQEERPLPGSPCLLTFDDGVLDHYFHVFKILQKRNLSGLFFALDRLEIEGLTLASQNSFFTGEVGAGWSSGSHLGEIRS